VPLPGVVDCLRTLAQRFGTVAIVSGRPVEFLRGRLPVDELALIGQYGLERFIGGAVVVDPLVAPFAASVAAVADAAEAALSDVHVERKGSVAVTLHWREHRDAGPAAQRWAEVAASEHGLSQYPTRMAVELRPPVPVDKGAAVAALCAGRSAALFAGDDHGDLSAFAALARLVGEGSLGRAVRVGVRSAEEPPELVGSTDLAVDGPEGLLVLLSSLAARA
jgi:trehalose 6-phosphate phosphatase